MNKYEKMEIVSFDNITDVYDTIGIELMQLEDPTDYIAVYGKVDLIKELFTTMIGDGYDFGYADFDAFDEMRKDMVYMMFIRGNCVISVEPAYSNNGIVIGHDAKVALFYMDDCKQDVIDYCVNRDMEVTLFDFEDYDCDECEDYDDSEDEGYTINGKPVTKEKFDAYVSQFRKTDDKPVTTSSTTYKVNGKECDKETYEKALNELDEKYLDNVQDMLLNYFDFVSEMNQWRKLLGWF